MRPRSMPKQRSKAASRGLISESQEAKTGKIKIIRHGYRDIKYEHERLTFFEWQY